MFDFDFGKYWNAAVDFLWRCCLSVVDVFKDLLIGIFDSFMKICISVLDTFSESLESLDFTQYFTALPEEVKNILGLLGVGTAFTMIASAILIRLILQLIPFTRLGS